MAILRAGKFFRFSLMTAVFLRILGKMPCARRARKGETAMSAKSTAPDLAGYRAWLQARECSAGTVEKYLRDVARFFAEAEAQSPAPKEAVAGWRDALAARGYAPSSVNAMLAAVNAYQTFSGNPQGRARPLKCQRRVFCEARRELSRREYFRLLDAARRTGRKRTLLVLQTLCATGIRVSELRFITAEAVRRGRAVIRCKGKCREILLPRELCSRFARWCRRRGVQAGPVFTGRGGQPLGRITVWKMLKALCEPAGVEKDKVFPHNLRHLFARTFYGVEKISRSWRTCSVTPASRRRASILWNRAPSTRSCSSACTCCCKATKVCFCCRTHAGYITEGSRSGRFAPPRSIKKHSKAVGRTMEAAAQQLCCVFF